MNREQLSKSLETFKGEVIKFADSIICQVVDPAKRPNIPTYLLAGIYMVLSEMANSLQFGNNYYDIRPVVLAAGVPQQICDVQTQGRVRKISIFTDAATGGPLPTIRISKSGTGSGSGGVRIVAGAISELGEVPANVKLWVTSSAAINLYVIERG